MSLSRIREITGINIRIVVDVEKYTTLKRQIYFPERESYFAKAATKD